MTTRRRFLCGLGGAVPATLAGCTGILDSGSASDYEPLDWIPDSLSEQPSAQVIDVAAIGDAVGLEEAGWDQTLWGLEPDDIDTYVVAATGQKQSHVLDGDIDSDAVLSWLDDTPFSVAEDGEYGGFDRYSGDALTVGFDDAVAVVAESADLFETTVDAGGGEAQRAIDSDDEFELFVDLVGDFAIYDHEWVTETAAETVGSATELGDAESTLWEVYIYADEATADDNLEKRREAAEADDVNARVDGRAVVLTASESTSDLFS